MTAFLVVRNTVMFSLVSARPPGPNRENEAASDESVKNLRLIDRPSGLQRFAIQGLHAHTDVRVNYLAGDRLTDNWVAPDPAEFRTDS